MSSRHRSRRLFLRVCWLALLCTAAMVAATPDVTAGNSFAKRVSVGAIADDPGAMLPPGGPETGTEVGDFAATEASRPFRLSLFLRHSALLGDDTARAYSHTPTIAGERGPPLRAR